MELFKKKHDTAEDLLSLIKDFVDKLEPYDLETSTLINKNLRKIAKIPDEETNKSFEKQVINTFALYKSFSDIDVCINDVLSIISGYTVKFDISQSFKNELTDLANRIIASHTLYVRATTSVDIEMIETLSKKIVDTFIETYEIEVESKAKDKSTVSPKPVPNPNSNPKPIPIKPKITHTPNPNSNPKPVETGFPEDLVEYKPKYQGKNFIPYHIRKLSAKPIVGSAEKNIIAGVDYIKKQFRETRVVSLYANVLQKLVDILYANNKPIMFHILEMLEDDKDFILEGQISNQFSGKTLIKDNPPLHRFGLLPVTDLLPIDELLKKILIEEKPTKTTSFSKLAQELSVGLIVFNRITYSPIEYNIRSLILPDVAKDFIQSDELGINAKTIARFTNINTMKKQKWNFSTELHNINAEKFYVLETLDGSTYRCLAPWVQSKTFSLSRFRINNIINYYSNIKSMKTAPSTRASNYHKLLIDKSLSNMFVQKPIELDSFEGQAGTVSTDKIRQELIYRLENAVKDIIKKEYKDNVKDNIEVNEIIHHKDLQTIFYDTILILFKTGVLSENIKDYDAGHFPFSEILSSFIVDILHISRRFSRELHDGYSRNALKAKVFDESKEQRLHLITKKINEVIFDAVHLIIKNTDNIYSALHYKYLLINFA